MNIENTKAQNSALNQTTLTFESSEMPPVCSPKVHLRAHLLPPKLADLISYDYNKSRSPMRFTERAWNGSRY